MGYIFHNNPLLGLELKKVLGVLVAVEQKLETIKNDEFVLRKDNAHV